jgi:hypothetical protein
MRAQVTSVKKQRETHERLLPTHAHTHTTQLGVEEDFLFVFSKMCWRVKMKEDEG